MKIQGADIPTYFLRSFALPRPNGHAFTLQLQPLPLGFHQRLRRAGITLPTPPLKIARDSAGKPIRDHHGLAVSMADPADPSYVTAVELYHQRVAVLALAEALRSDPHTTFDAQPPSGDQPDALPVYADALFAELEQAGFTAGDLVLLCREICRMSNLLDDHLQEATANFSRSVENDSA